MTFDIIEVTEDQLSNMSAVQMQLLRNAQKKKNELQHSMEGQLRTFGETLNGNNFSGSSFLAAREKDLKAEFDYQVEILREQLLYALELNEPFPGENDESAGYIVDYSLSYVDRYAIVREYYLAIEDPVERMNLYEADEVARRYLGSYYTTLYNVLYTYSH